MYAAQNEAYRRRKGSNYIVRNRTLKRSPPAFFLLLSYCCPIVADLELRSLHNSATPQPRTASSRPSSDASSPAFSSSGSRRTTIHQGSRSRRRGCSCCRRTRSGGGGRVVRVGVRGPSNNLVRVKCRPLSRSSCVAPGSHEAWINTVPMVMSMSSTPSAVLPLKLVVYRSTVPPSLTASPEERERRCVRRG